MTRVCAEREGKINSGRSFSLVLPWDRRRMQKLGLCLWLGKNPPKQVRKFLALGKVAVLAAAVDGLGLRKKRGLLEREREQTFLFFFSTKAHLNLLLL
jgi:hypothetical protein